MRKLGRLGVLVSVALMMPVVAVACGGDSDSGGSSGSGGTGATDSGTGGVAAGGNGGASGAGATGGGGTGATGGGGTGATGGGGSGGTTNECAPAPSPPGGAGGQAGAAGAAGAAGSGAGGAPADGGVSSITCGTTTCNAVSVLGGVYTLSPCCSDEGCGVAVDATVAGAIGATEGCYGLNQAGTPDSTCPTFSVANPLGGGNLDFAGCCHADGTCGFALDLSGFQGPNLGCARQDCNGAGPKTCTP